MFAGTRVKVEHPTAASIQSWGDAVYKDSPEFTLQCAVRLNNGAVRQACEIGEGQSKFFFAVPKCELGDRRSR